MNIQIDKINELCKKYRITKYSINPDGAIDVDGNVDLASLSLTEIPLKFGRVKGKFNIQHNKLISLNGAPLYVGGHFTCYNNNLKNLVGAPILIGGDFISCNNQLSSLNGSPTEVLGNYYITANDQLKSLEGCESLKIGGNLCFDDTMASTFSGDTDIELKGRFFLNQTNYNNLQMKDVGFKKLADEIIYHRIHLN